MDIGNGGDIKGYEALTAGLNSKSFMESYLDKMKFPSSPRTPTLVLPDYLDMKSTEDCSIVSFSPPLLLPLRRKAIKKLSPIDVKRLSIHMYPHVAQQVANNTINQIEESMRNSEVVKDYVVLVNDPPKPPLPPPPPSVSTSRMQTLHPPPQAPPPPPPPPLPMASQVATVTTSPPPLAPRIPGPPPPPPPAPMTPNSVPPPMQQGRGGPPLSPSPSPLTSSSSKTPLPPPPPPPPPILGVFC